MVWLSTGQVTWQCARAASADVRNRSGSRGDQRQSAQPDIAQHPPAVFLYHLVGSSNWQGVIRGVTPSYFTAREWAVTAGREMIWDDNVVLLGTTMRDKLFGQADAIDALLRIRDVPFTVIGVLKRKGQSVWGDDQDDVALVPITYNGSRVSWLELVACVVPVDKIIENSAHMFGATVFVVEIIGVLPYINSYNRNLAHGDGSACVR
jgi:MacB-like periplasmic core domain